MKIVAKSDFATCVNTPNGYLCGEARPGITGLSQHKNYAIMKIRLFTIPNVITLLNLGCGSIAALYALRFDDLQIAFWFIMAAAVFDFLDGFAARLLKSYSEVGKQLDSLADTVSFGFAPSAILFSIYQSSGGIGMAGFLVFILAAFSALRLARFNIDPEQSDEFIGMPTPACAIFVASAGHVFASGLYSVTPVFVILITLFLSAMLVLPVRMFSLKFHDFSLRGNALRYAFLILSLAGIVAWGIRAIPFVIMGYAVISACRNMVCSKCR